MSKTMAKRAGEEKKKRTDSDFLMGELSAEPTLYTVLLPVWLMISGSTYLSVSVGKRKKCVV